VTTTRDQHEAQAKENFAVYSLLAKRGKHLDWAITALAYSALHYVDGHLLPQDPRNHAERNLLIQRKPAVRTVWLNYRLLLQKSRDARYECYDPTVEEVERLRAQLYDPIVTHLRSLRPPRP